MLRKGFTLIALLIVITIIAILAGAAIPYVQDYVEDARIATAKADMNEIKNALTRYELDRGTEYTDATITPLVGAYLGKAITDPWGVPYQVINNDCQIRSWGANRVDNDGQGDDINVDFRAPLAVTKVFFVDADNSASVTTNDSLRVRFSRPVSTTDVGGMDNADWGVNINGTTGTIAAMMGGVTITCAMGTGAREAVLTFGGIPSTSFVSGRDALYYVRNGSLRDQVTPTPNECNANEYSIKPLK